MAIIGRLVTLMQLLGIDVAAHLNTVREEFHDRDFSDLATLEAGDKGSLARAIMLSTHGTPGPFHHNIPVEFSASDPEGTELARLNQSASSVSHGTEEDFGKVAYLTRHRCPLAKILQGQLPPC
jgi:hypothetical protein